MKPFNFNNGIKQQKKLTKEEWEDQLAAEEVSKAESKFDEDYGHQSQYWSF